MLENQYNTIFKNTLINMGFIAHKIQDQGNGFRISSPFDGFFFGKKYSGAWEGKRIKDISSFNFNHFEEQQIISLEKVSKTNDTNIGIVSLYVDISRKSFCILFDITLIKYLQLKGKNSILGKELAKLEKFYRYKKSAFFEFLNKEDFFSENVVTISRWEEIFNGN